MGKFIGIGIAIVVAIGLLSMRDGGSKPTKGSIVIKGSDTEVQLVSNLAEAFRAKEPTVEISVTGGGSSVGLSAIINGEIDLANSSRAMKDDELAQAKERGQDVHEFVLARDGLSVITHPENSVKTLSLDEVSRIYKGDVTNWNQVGGPNQAITLYGRQSTSGTYVFFRDVVVKAEYAASMRNMEGNQAIFDAVAGDTSGIGYIGVGYMKDGTTVRAGVTALTIRAGEGDAVSPLDRDAVIAGRYPIVRPIFQYVRALPGRDSALANFLTFESSEAGQTIVESTGFYPLTADDRANNDAFFEKLR